MKHRYTLAKYLEVSFHILQTHNFYYKNYLKRFILSQVLVYGILINSLQIKKYLDDHPVSDTAADEAPTVIYMTIRCSGLYAFYAVTMKEKNPEAAAKLTYVSTLFAHAAAKIDSQFSDRSFGESLKNMIVAAEKIMKSYKKDGEDNWTKTGSFTQGSYIEDDDKICKDAKKNVMNQ